MNTQFCCACNIEKFKKLSQFEAFMKTVSISQTKELSRSFERFMVHEVLQEQVQFFKAENEAAQETFLWPCFSFGSFPKGLDTHVYTFLGNQKLLLSS